MKDIIKEAGKILRQGYEAKKYIQKKSSVDLVTEYDVKIEEFLRKQFTKKYSDYAFVGEESFSGKIPSKAIIVDPIDGTTNFVHHLAFVSISVAVWEDGKPQEGIVYNPILEEFFYAKRGDGAYLNGQKIEVAQTDKLIDTLIATGFPYTKTQRGRDYRFVIKSMTNLLPITRDIRRFGSAAIDLAYVACGRFAGFYEVNLKPWDVAAGILLVQEAGGKVTNHLGKPYKFGDIIVASNGKVHQEIICNLGAWD
ncbi:inositol monophosphatase family protein [Nitratiruptor sp. YY09-18]|uniref:inositol monophosphatase family protein n=1 Tax=Nitratiruptor sp. YY09-18 TaxID=2724901 RepID=UPI0019381562|nr:inositol monophosphatase family protein [Nitratiruptor sp. YY09-18]BCD68822.1 myo-inositol-1(or 4)-monophosphatase [Nitratiruptor sp. YY09-18]